MWTVTYKGIRLKMLALLLSDTLGKPVPHPLEMHSLDGIFSEKTN